MKAEDDKGHHPADQPSTLSVDKSSESKLTSGEHTPQKSDGSRLKNNFLVRMISAFLGYVVCSSWKDKTNTIFPKDEEEKRFLLTRKLDYISTLATVSMTWWVSSLVFCGSIIAAVWMERDKLIAYPIICPLAAFISLFFTGLVLFGAHISWCYLPKLSRELSILTKTPDDQKNILSSELSVFRWLMSVGTGSFIFILLGWLLFWRTLPCQW